MARLQPCKACGSFRKPAGACPSCGDTQLSVASTPTAAAVLLGLTFAGCTVGNVEPAYGIMDSNDTSETGDTNETDDTDDTDGTQAEYGVADTDFDTDTGTGQPEYGVADTDFDTDSTQADYGVASTDFQEAELKKE